MLTSGAGGVRERPREGQAASRSGSGLGRAAEGGHQTATEGSRRRAEGDGWARDGRRRCRATAAATTEGGFGGSGRGEGKPNEG